MTKRSISLLMGFALALGLLLSSSVSAQMSTRAGSTARAGSGATMTAEDIACAKTAVLKRESAVGSAWATYSEAISDAGNDRYTGLEVAWSSSVPSEIKRQVNAVWTAFRTVVRSAKKTFNEAKKSAWKTFKSEIKICRGASGSDAIKSDSTGESVDNSL